MTSGITLLLAEDDLAIAELMEAALSDAGYDVVVVFSGTQALQQVETEIARFRAVITDIQLGDGPDGWQIAQRARELVATVPVVYMSGDSVHEWPSKGVPSSVILSKPFVPAQLVIAVSTLVTEADMHAPPDPNGK